MSDPEGLGAWEAYSAHLIDILDELGDGTEVLVSDIHLGGAVVDRYEYENGVLMLEMMTGNTINGYEWVTFHYDGVVALTPDPHSLDFLIQPPTELMQDELDLVDGYYEHRILCWPEGELDVRFRSLRHERRPGTVEERATFD